MNGAQPSTWFVLAYLVRGDPYVRGELKEFFLC
jgi:hypothetical protein